MKKILVVIGLISLVLITGCSNEDKDLKVINCNRKAETTNGEKTSLKYKIYYKGKKVAKTVSTEKVTSNDSSIIKKYKNAYENVFSQYKNIDNYDNKVTVSGNTVTSETVIDYRKVDVSKIIKIEGEEDNIFTGKKVYLKKLLAFYKKYGVKCDD